MPKAISVATFTREDESHSWGTPKVETPASFTNSWESNRMVLIVEDACAHNVLVNLDSIKTSMMARLSLEDAIALQIGRASCRERV